MNNLPDPSTLVVTPSKTNPENKPGMVIRIKTSIWGKAGRFHIDRRITFLRRLSTPHEQELHSTLTTFQWWQECVSMVGLEGELKHLPELSTLKDGLYEMIGHSDGPDRDGDCDYWWSVRPYTEPVKGGR